MFDARSSGILLHITSLPSGRLGTGAWEFVEFLAAAQQRWWQVLPLHPVSAGAGNSPYATLSAFALDPRLRDPEDDVAPDPRAFERFCDEQAGWLEGWLLFAALRERFERRPWTDWPEELRGRVPRALRAAAADSRERLDALRREQFEARRQWDALRAYANERGVRLIGDLPFYVAHDSADVWARPELFRLDAHGRPTHVAGVPPDYFSETGQLWAALPVYRWAASAAAGHDWWLARLGHALETFDAVRFDHFRGLVAHWEVPAGAATAEGGRWVDGPAEGLLEPLRALVPELTLIAEDLGTPDARVDRLMERYGLPGMRVLQFAFGDDYPESSHLPSRHPERCVVCTGTHDNPPSRAWYAAASAEERARLAEVVGREIAEEEAHVELVRLALASPAGTAILPLQDVLGLGADARMNTPGTSTGNWSWRLEPGALDERVADRLAARTRTAGRAG